MAAVREEPTSVRVRKLEPWIIESHTQLAKNEGISLEEHLRGVLAQHILQAQRDFADEMRTHRAEVAAKFGTDFPKSEDLIRAVREDSC